MMAQFIQTYHQAERANAPTLSLVIKKKALLKFMVDATICSA